MKDRIKRIRKESGLSQEKFGEKLGVTKTAISKMELGTYNVTDTMLKLICTEFHVSENWLRTGKEPMFIQKDNTPMEKLREQYNLDELDEHIISSYLSLPEKERAVIKKYVENLAEAFRDDMVLNEEADQSDLSWQPDPDQITPEDLEAMSVDHPAVKKVSGV